MRTLLRARENHLEESEGALTPGPGDVCVQQPGGATTERKNRNYPNFTQRGGQEGGELRDQAAAKSDGTDTGDCAMPRARLLSQI